MDQPTTNCEKQLRLFLRGDGCWARISASRRALPSVGIFTESSAPTGCLTALFPLRAKERTRSRGSALRAEPVAAMEWRGKREPVTSRTSCLENRGVNQPPPQDRRTPMSDKPISPLRRRMIDDMTGRNFVEKTRNDYIGHVRTFTAFLGRAPDPAAPEDLRLFQLHQRQTGVGAPSINGSVAALRFFFTVTLDRPEMVRHLTFVREPRRIPVVLSLEEIARLLEAAPGPKYKAALSAAYGAGLRVSEVVALKVSDIDSERMLLRIEQGKGRKDRFAMLSPRLLELLRDWYRVARPAVWLFPGRDPLLPLTTRQFNRTVHAAADRAALKKRVTPPTLRHSFATHLLEAQ